MIIVLTNQYIRKVQMASKQRPKQSYKLERASNFRKVALLFYLIGLRLNKIRINCKQAIKLGSSQKIRPKKNNYMLK